MGNLLDHALGAAQARPHARSAAQALATLLVAGAGGALGSAVLEHALASRRFGAVRVLVTQALRVSLQELEAVETTPASPPCAGLADTALVVFDTMRRANGRDDAFLRPQPRELPVLAQWLHASGVRDLVVVMPHRAASLPQALKAGLADLDEHAVARLGFERVVFVRSAQAPRDERANAWLQRVADGVLAQLRIMTPQPDQPVRSNQVARFVAELASQLPASAAGTRVAAPELVWLAAQQADPAGLVRAWLAGESLPVAAARPMRL
jgi:hypothetical protein